MLWFAPRRAFNLGGKIVAASAILLIVLAADAIAAEPPQAKGKPVEKPEFKIKADMRPRVHEGDGVVAVVEKDSVVFRITNAGGIGGVDIERVRGDWPKAVVLLFVKPRSFESFALTCGPLRLHGRGAEKMILRLERRAGETHWVEDPKAGDEFRVIGRLRPDGLELTLPAALLGKDDKVLTVGWIDAFRG